MQPVCPPTRRYRFWSFGLVICLGGLIAIRAESATGPQTAPADPQVMYRRALQAIENGRRDEAVSFLEPLYVAHPEVFSYGLLLANVYVTQGRPDKARPVLGELVAHPPEDVEARLLLADVLKRAKQWQEIIRLLEPVLGSESRYEVHHLLAKAYAARQQSAQALAHYKAAIDLHPGAAEDHQSIGDLHLSAGRNALAADAYLEANAKGLDTPELAFKLATALAGLGNNIGDVQVRHLPGAEVGQLLDEGYVLSPARGDEANFHVCPPVSALYQIQRAMKLGLDTPEVRFLRAEIWLKIGAFRRALEDYKSVEQHVPPDKLVEYCTGRAQAHVALQEYDEYIKYTRRAAKQTPDRFGEILAAAYLDIAERFQQRGDLDNNILYLRNADQVQPRNAVIHNRLGYAYWDKKEYEQAVRHWRICLELQPEHLDRAKILDLIEAAARKAKGETPPTDTDRNAPPSR